MKTRTEPPVGTDAPTRQQTENDLFPVEAGSLLAGQRILVVEDRFVLAEEIVDMLLEFGCVPVGPTGKLLDALSLLDNPEFSVSAALLDIDLNGEVVFPLAEALEATGIPFAFATGYNDAALPDEWRYVLRLEKPYGPISLRDVLERLLDGTASPALVRRPGSACDNGIMSHRQWLASPRYETARKSRERQMERDVLRKWNQISGEPDGLPGD